MKKVLSFIAACVLCIAAFTPVYAADQDMVFNIKAKKIIQQCIYIQPRKTRRYMRTNLAQQNALRLMLLVMGT